MTLSSKHTPPDAQAQQRKRRIGISVVAALLVTMALHFQAPSEAANADTATAESEVQHFAESSQRIVLSGSWKVLTNQADEGGASRYAQSAATAEMTFVGNRIEWVGRTSRSSGIARVYLDGRLVDTVDRYSSSETFRTRLFQRDVTFGLHSIKIEWTGTANPAASGDSLHLDGFNVGIPAGAAAGLHEQTSTAVTTQGAWAEHSSSADSGQSSVSADQKASASMAFVGTSVSLIARKSAAGGIANIFIDGAKVAEIDRYAAATSFQQTLFQRSGLAAGTHTISIEWTGRKNAASRGTSIHLDAFEVSGGAQPASPPGIHDDQSAAVKYSGPWRPTVSGADYSGSSVYVTSAGSAALRFSGTGIAWIGRKTPSSGIVDVYIDGKLEKTVDRYSSKYLAQDTAFRIDGLANGEHEIRIDWTGRKNPSSSGTSVSFDAFVASKLSTLTPAAVRASASSAAFGTFSDRFTSSVSWAPVTAAPGQDLEYVITRSAAGSAGSTSFVSDGSPHHDVGLTESTDYSYTVQARDQWGFRSRTSAVALYRQGALIPQDVASTNAAMASACSRPTKTVNDGVSLRAALQSAVAGDTISMLPGVYRGWPKASGDYQGFSMSGKAGSPTSPITVCGQEGARVSLSPNAEGKLDSGTAFIVSDSAYVRFHNVEIENAFVGINVRRSNNVAIDQATISSTAQAGIYLSDNTTASQITRSRISDTGRNDARYGEGIYIGNSTANSSCAPDCPADASDRNIIAWNSTSDTRAEALEAKEQTTGGLVYQNTFGATGNGGGITSSTVQIKGSGYAFYGNTVRSNLAHGLRILSGDYDDGQTWGESNHIAKNKFETAVGSTSSVYSFATFGNVVKCSNESAPSSVPLSNASCVQ